MDDCNKLSVKRDMRNFDEYDDFTNLIQQSKFSLWKNKLNECKKLQEKYNSEFKKIFI